MPHYILTLVNRISKCCNQTICQMHRPNGLSKLWEKERYLLGIEK